MQSAGTTAITVDTSQNVGIGTTTPTATGGYDKAIDLVGGSSGAGLYIRGATNPSTVYASIQYDNSSNRTNINAVGTSNFLRFVTVDTERMRIDSSGSLLINETTQPVNTYKQVITFSGGGGGVGGGLLFNDVDSGNTYPAVYFRKDGAQRGNINVSTSGTLYNTVSDYRLKENVIPMVGALAKVSALKPVTYKWKESGLESQGFIAHELAEVCPDAVTGDKDAVGEEQYEVTPAIKDEEGRVVTEAVMGTRTVPVYQGIDTSFLVATLTAAIQELKAINDTQAETINALTARIEALEGN